MLRGPLFWEVFRPTMNFQDAAHKKAFFPAVTVTHRDNQYKIEIYRAFYLTLLAESIRPIWYPLLPYATMNYKAISMYNNENRSQVKLDWELLLGVGMDTEDMEDTDIKGVGLEEGAALRPVENTPYFQVEPTISSTVYIEMKKKLPWSVSESRRSYISLNSAVVIACLLR